MKKETLWQAGIKVEKNKKVIHTPYQTDILIIGGGIAGIETAYHLKDSKQKVTVIDSDIIGFGVSSNSTGKLTYLQELPYHKLTQTFDFYTALKYLESQKEAIQIARKNTIRNNIDCNFEIVSSYTFTNDEKKIKAFQKEQDFFDKIKLPYQVVDSLPIPYSIKYGIRVDDTAIFHPVKYIRGLLTIIEKKGIDVYENVRALTLEKHDKHYIVHTNRGDIVATKVVVTTHYPFFLDPGWIPLRTHIEKDYVGAASIDNVHNFSAITEGSPTESIRYHQDKNAYIIYAGESHKTDQAMDAKKEYEKLKKQMEDYLQVTPLYQWSTHDVMTNDGLPFIGRMEKKNDHLLIATGFNKWGMTNGIIAGKILSDILLGKENEYEKIFDPNRSFNKKKITSFFLDVYQTSKSILKTKFHTNKPYYPNNVKITHEDGKKIGIYTDENGREHKVRNLCPHLKCSLIFNEVDKTWDCPCHGSRFDIDGNVIEGPSVYDIKL